MVEVTKVEKVKVPHWDNPNQMIDRTRLSLKAVAVGTNSRNGAFWRKVGGGSSTFSPNILMDDEQLKRAMETLGVKKASEMKGKRFDDLGARLEIVYPNGESYGTIEAGTNGWYASKDDESVLMRLSVVEIEHAKIVVDGSAVNTQDLGAQTASKFDLTALGEAADAEDEQAIEQLQNLADEYNVSSQDNFDELTWSEVATEIAAQMG